MSKKIIKKQRLDYRHYICISVILICCICAYWYLNSYARLIQSFKDIALSFTKYFCEMFFIPNKIVPSVQFVAPSTGFGGSMGYTPDNVGQKWSEFGQMLISKDNLYNYFFGFANGLLGVVTVISMLIPFFILFHYLFKRYLKKQNNDYNIDSEPLKRFKQLSLKYYVPSKRWFLSFIEFVKSNKKYLYIVIAIWALHLNAVTIIVELFAYLFYLIYSFDFASLSIQFYKLMLDMQAVFKIPVFVWVIGFVWLFLIVRKNIAYGRLHKYEYRNRNIINSFGIVTMLVGSMGTGKTRTLCDMVLSQDVEFVEITHKKLLENDLKFPQFSWIAFENSLKHMIENHIVYNLATCRKWVKMRYAFFEKRPLKSRLWGYDYALYGLEYDSKLKIEKLSSVLETYAQLYFIYIVQGSNIISNFGIRTDKIFQSIGNFPLWDTDFFLRDTKNQKDISSNSKILDFDMLRLGQQVLQNNKNANAFEFGVVAVTEIAKERGNQLDTKHLKKDSNSANQLNDKFNICLKMVRHSATVDNCPFVKVYSDDQRAESLGADNRELCDIVHIGSVSDVKLSMPCFYEELLFNCLFGKFKRLYDKYRFNRGDNTLFMYLVKKVVATFNNYCSRAYNSFGYFQNNLQMEKGTLDGDFTESKYYVSLKKTYSNRYATDCFSDFYNKKSLNSEVGINDLQCYEDTKATIDELKKQNSYFISSILDIGVKENENSK